VSAAGVAAGGNAGTAPGHEAAAEARMRELRSETPRAERIRVKWRPEVDFCVPVYFIGCIMEMLIFLVILPSKRWVKIYQEYHLPIIACCVCLPMTIYLGIVTLSPIDEDALCNDPNYQSGDPVLRSKAVQRQLRYSEITWKVCIWINTICSIILFIAYATVAHWVHVDLAKARLSTTHFAYAGTMSFLYALTVIGNYRAIQRVNRVGRRGFAAGLDSLTLEAQALLSQSTVPVESMDGASAKGEAEGSAGGTLRQRSGAAAPTARASPTAPADAPSLSSPLGLAMSATQQFMRGDLDRMGLQQVLRTLGVKLSTAPVLQHLMLLHERTGKGDWIEFARALQEALGSAEEVPPPPYEEPVLTPEQAAPGQA